MRCPICNKRIAWYGDGDGPSGPCIRCQRELTRVPTSVTDFWETVPALDQAAVIRRRELVPTRQEEGEPFVNLVYWTLSWRAPVQVEDIWQMLTCVERLPVDDFGNVHDEGSIWQRIHTHEIPLIIDTSWTGSF